MHSLSSSASTSFTHNDPFEDTESVLLSVVRARLLRFTHNDPFEDTERDVAVDDPQFGKMCFTHNDPFEDTESTVGLDRRVLIDAKFHPQRSVRGY